MLKIVLKLCCTKKCKQTDSIDLNFHFKKRAKFFLNFSKTSLCFYSDFDAFHKFIQLVRKVFPFASRQSMLSLHVSHQRVSSGERRSASGHETVESDSAVLVSMRSKLIGRKKFFTAFAALQVSNFKVKAVKNF